MAETVLINAATVAAAASCAVEDIAVPAASDYMTFRIACDQPHTIKFYGAESAFSALSSAALYPDETRTYVPPTTGTAGSLYLFDPGARNYVACVVTNNGSENAEVTVAAE